eukprot:366095-Chlamydomonas_euryale.AAC.11
MAHILYLLKNGRSISEWTHEGYGYAECSKANMVRQQEREKSLSPGEHQPNPVSEDSTGQHWWGLDPTLARVCEAKQKSRQLQAKSPFVGSATLASAVKNIGSLQLVQPTHISWSYPTGACAGGPELGQIGLHGSFTLHIDAVCNSQLAPAHPEEQHESRLQQQSMVPVISGSETRGSGMAMVLRLQGRDQPCDVIRGMHTCFPPPCHQGLPAHCPLSRTYPLKGNQVGLRVTMIVLNHVRWPGWPRGAPAELKLQPVHKVELLTSTRIVLGRLIWGTEITCKHSDTALQTMLVASPNVCLLFCCSIVRVRASVTGSGPTRGMPVLSAARWRGSSCGLGAVTKGNAAVRGAEPTHTSPFMAPSWPRTGPFMTQSWPRTSPVMAPS